MPSPGGSSAAPERSRSSTSHRGCGAPRTTPEEDFAAFREAVDDSPIDAVLIHAVYLLNAATTDRAMRSKTRASLIQSLRVGDGIRARGVVLHAGSAKQGNVSKAITRAGKLVQEALSESEHCQLHFEDTAGAGGTLGRSFEELAALIDAAGGDARVGLCLDSCHLLASGYDVRTAGGLSATLDDCDRVVGLDRLGSLHVNDSLAALGSNRDRHAILGQGELGPRGCGVFLSEPRFDSLPCVLETGTEGGGVSADDVSRAFTYRRNGQAARSRAARRASASAR